MLPLLPPFLLRIHLPLFSSGYNQRLKEMSFPDILSKVFFYSVVKLFFLNSPTLYTPKINAYASHVPVDES